MTKNKFKKEIKSIQQTIATVEKRFDESDYEIAILALRVASRMTVELAQEIEKSLQLE
ncbi:hypothetical protein [Edwardsiella tarda]|uniref:hypothetical protein n=1 Tax=Edwardsiella tarda TaxID=636 RepID=UPI003F65BC7A